MNKQILVSTVLAAGIGCTHEVSKGEQGKVYVFRSDASGFDTKTIFYDNGEEVVAFDAQFTPDLARQAVKFLREKTSNPLKYVVVTHPNPDKFNGLSVFKEEGALIIASEATASAIPGVHAYKKYFFVSMAKMFSETSYPKPIAIDRTFSDTMDLVLNNGDRIMLRELSKPGISSTQTVAFIPNVNALVVGDLVHHKAHAWLEGGIVSGMPKPEIAGWKQDLLELQNLYSRQNPIVYGGRGQDALLSVATPTQISYLESAEAIVDSYVESLGGLRGELRTDKAATHYKELSKRFSETFADYELSYMIDYGIYGLVQSKLQ